MKRLFFLLPAFVLMLLLSFNSCELAKNVNPGNTNTNSVSSNPPTVSITLGNNFDTSSVPGRTLMPLGNLNLELTANVVSNGSKILSVELYAGTQLLNTITDGSDGYEFNVDWYIMFGYGRYDLYLKCNYGESLSTAQSVYSSTNTVYGYKIGINSTEVTKLGDQNAITFRINPSDYVIQRLFDISSLNNVRLIGDFNQWDSNDTAYDLVMDGNFYAITLTNISSNQQYGFLIDHDGEVELIPDIYNFRINELGSGHYNSFIPPFEHYVLHSVQFTFQPSGNHYQGYELTNAYLVGSFNNWDTLVDKMTFNSSSNYYEMTKYLIEGTHSYVFRYTDLSNIHSTTFVDRKVDNIYSGEDTQYYLCSRMTVPFTPPQTYQLSGEFSNIGEAKNIEINMNTGMYIGTIDLIDPAPNYHLDVNLIRDVGYNIQLYFGDHITTNSNCLASLDYTIVNLVSNTVIPSMSPEIDYGSFYPTGNVTDPDELTWVLPTGIGKIRSVILSGYDYDDGMYFDTNIGTNATSMVIPDSLKESGHNYRWTLYFISENGWNGGTIDNHYTVQ